MTPIDWYFNTFVPDPERGYAQMNPPGADAKYSRKHQPLTKELIGGGLGHETRRLKINGQWQTIALSIAVTPEHRDGWARAAMLDVDTGGTDGIYQVFTVCAQPGLWAFAQLGASDDHTGGHVYIPVNDPMPASLLEDLAARIQASAGVLGEAYPCGHDLRLPLMPHLRAPDGPRRFPLLLQSGALIDASDAWAALDILRTHWQPNSAEQITRALASLPARSSTNPARLHKSKVNPQNTASVIHWYNDNYSAPDLLASLGVQGADRLHVVRCPWHDDRSPSLGIWRDHSTEHFRCRCFSRNSNCPAAAVPYLDSFNIFCMINGLTAADAVRALAEQHHLGQRRQFQATSVDPDLTTSIPDLLETHRQTLQEARTHLADALRTAAEQPGHITAIRATPGLGKTTVAAHRARALHTDGQTVAIAVPSHQIADEEWRTRIHDAFIWQARTKLCTCYPPDYLVAVTAKGYALPECVAGCPYLDQYEQRRGRITIYQHNHLHLNDGELLDGADLVIIDESPLGMLLAEHSIGQDALRRLGNRLAKETTPDPALPLLRALWRVAHTTRRHARSLRGPALRDALTQVLGAEQLEQAIADAGTSHTATRRRKADGITPADQLPPLFFGAMLDALQHDTLAWDGIAWRWYERHSLLASRHGKTTAPAVIVLDGSADPLIAERLYAPWPVDVVQIDVPLSPTVRVVQCPITPSTRKIVQDPAQRDRLTRAIAGVCHHLDLVIDGGISYLDSESHFAQELGGNWLHYGGQRGRNDLKDARTLAIIASPTTPPDALERKAEALWQDDPTAIDCTWQHHGQGDWRAADARLEAMNRLHGAEELRQAAHRCRPILCDQPTTLLICSPWDCAALGLAPHTTITQLPYTTSHAAAQAHTAYQQARMLAHPTVTNELQQNGQIQYGVSDPPINLKEVENADFIAATTAPPTQHNVGEALSMMLPDQTHFDPAILPGVRSGAIAPDDPWLRDFGAAVFGAGP